MLKEPAMGETDGSLYELLGQQVVLDTAGSLTYLGTLQGIGGDGFWLEDADIRDRSEGHQTKEHYICEARENGVRANRKRIFVFREGVMSMSALKDVIAG